jgi:predicted TIM-barrel fold metal-dependent hydrolase
MSGSANSVVTVGFHAEGAGTRVVLDHTGFATDEIRAKHDHGWNACLDSLAARVLEPART